MQWNQVKLISSSKMDDMSILEQVAYVARVSNPQNQSSRETSESLCKYLLKHKHFSPFEMVHICLEIKTTRDISRQLLRHRSFCFQEFSQRYASVSEDFILRETRFQDTKNRQNSYDLNESSEQQVQVAETFTQMQQELIEKERKFYQFCGENGIAKEVSRVILSEGLCPTTLYVSGNLRSWIHYIQVRTDETTQKEHRDLAEKVSMEIEKIFPLIREIKM